MITGTYAGSHFVSQYSPAYADEIGYSQAEAIRKADKRALELLACDHRTPVALLRRLAFHHLADVRAAVSDNENTPLDTLWALAEDSDADVRCQLAENHNLPLALIRALTNDENPYVACRAQKTFDRLRAN